MKLLIFTDLHGDLNMLHKQKARIKEENIDLVLIPGDISMMGRQLKPLLSRLNTFKVPILIIHGNHEDEEEFEFLVSKFDNITYLHKKIIEINGWWFGAYSTCGLREEYPEQEEWVAKNHDKLIKAENKLIWMDHPPPRDTFVDELELNWHVGSYSLRRFIEKYTPTYVFCGHIHETFGREDMVNDTIIINPGPIGTVIELD